MINFVNHQCGCCDLKLGYFSVSASGGINNIFDRVYSSRITINSADRRFYNAGAPENFTGSVDLGYIF